MLDKKKNSKHAQKNLSHNRKQEYKHRVFEDQREVPLSAMFLGPHAENADVFLKLVNEIVHDYIYWRRNQYPGDPIIVGRQGIDENSEWFDHLDMQLRIALNELKAHFPFHSPRYLAHMLSEQTMPGMLGYLAGMLYNPNNVTEEAAPVTVEKEIQFGQMVCEMLGYDKTSSWAHICSGGTLANLEAFWVARETQFYPLIIKQFCETYTAGKDFAIKLPNGRKKKICEVDTKTMLSLKPNEAIYMIQKLLKYLINQKKIDIQIAFDALNSFIPQSDYSVKHRGFTQVLQTVGLKPVLFVPESAHYSWKKVANILGYGESAIRTVPLNGLFRQDVHKLAKKTSDIANDEYIAGVVAVAGTTEEGAVDPVHQIHYLRNMMEVQKNRSFWLHIDAAWGGYIRALFNEPSLRKEYSNKKIDTKADLDQLIDTYMETMNVAETFHNFYGAEKKIAWDSREVIAAYIAFPVADSITVDPHKLEYAPYPAGVIAFKNKAVTQIVTQEAQYISDVGQNVTSIELPEIKSVGPYILEGSKPGAAAFSCWLTATMIPLNLHNHGKIMKTTLLNAQKFAYYLKKHHTMTFIEAEKHYGQTEVPETPFCFLPIYNNIDTNVVCFIVAPMDWVSSEFCDKAISGNNHIPGMQMKSMSLEQLNQLNKQIYQRFTIDPEQRSKAMPSYFLSRTRLTSEQYSYDSIKELLGKIKVSEKNYEQEGLFVLRSTIMNPWYFQALKGQYETPHDYFLDFLFTLHKESRDLLNNE